MLENARSVTVMSSVQGAATIPATKVAPLCNQIGEAMDFRHAFSQHVKHLGFFSCFHHTQFESCWVTKNCQLEFLSHCHLRRHLVQLSVAL